MFVELHMLQNFAPSNLNRDDTGMPKECEFGGYRRARISSQCLKRAVRREFQSEGLMDPQFLATRTARVIDSVAGRLSGQGKGQEEAVAVARAALQGIGVGVGEDNKTDVLLFLGAQEIRRLTELCLEHWGPLSGAGGASPGEEGQPRRAARRARQAAFPTEVRTALLGALDGGRAADLALFGRMVAARPDRNIDAASQVAHALSTNRISMELDYYTAMDDLSPEDTAGAGMIGTVGFNSGCFYRYSNVDLGQLERNLQGDTDLAHRTLEAFIRASVNAIPDREAKQHGRPQPTLLCLRRCPPVGPLEPGQRLPGPGGATPGRGPVGPVHRGPRLPLGEDGQDVRGRCHRGEMGPEHGRGRAGQPRERPGRFAGRPGWESPRGNHRDAPAGGVMIP